MASEFPTTVQNQAHKYQSFSVHCVAYAFTSHIYVKDSAIDEANIKYLEPLEQLVAQGQ